MFWLQNEQFLKFKRLPYLVIVDPFHFMIKIYTSVLILDSELPLLVVTASAFLLHLGLNFLGLIYITCLKDYVLSFYNKDILIGNCPNRNITLWNTVIL